MFEIIFLNLFRGKGGRKLIKPLKAVEAFLSFSQMSTSITGNPSTDKTPTRQPRVGGDLGVIGLSGRKTRSLCCPFITEDKSRLSRLYDRCYVMTFLK